MTLFDQEAEAALARQPPDIHRLLLAASILDRLSGSLCDSVCESKHSAAVLAELVEREPFLQRDGGWYVLRREYADVWRNRLFHLHHEQLAGLHRRASLWYEQAGELEDAIRHAMSAGDWERAAKLVRSASPRHLNSGASQVVLDWLAALPEGVVRGDAGLCLLHGWALLLAGRTGAARQRLADADAAHVPGRPRRAADALRSALASPPGELASNAELARAAFSRLLLDFGE